ncbi:hypothetical protein RA086_03830 [Lactiplantibacillus sp. WILCCON 0030]|uniref:Integral membrane protein n=1 Tax=Lactiplantibacillus brownii TaxID=3069269 RepID=A0ABU1A762_9LACO|nr:hypothetical protein [Lactiplantibacillus brownii]MDQ7936776.1 hypothetical protein [Lactiplantibacillus brownii]
MDWGLINALGYLVLVCLCLRSFWSFVAATCWLGRQVGCWLLDEPQISRLWVKLPLNIRLQQQHPELRFANLINGLGGYVILTAGITHYWTVEQIDAGALGWWAWGLIGILLVINSYQRRFLRYYRQHPLS